VVLIAVLVLAQGLVASVLVGGRLVRWVSRSASVEWSMRAVQGCYRDYGL
jgi:hypothetical protein